MLRFQPRLGGLALRRARSSLSSSTLKFRSSLSTLAPQSLVARQSSTERQQAFFSTAKRDPGLALTSVISHPREVPGPGPEVPSRAQQLRKLENADQDYDLLVIGGGATGAGIALDAATRGLRVACIERGDFSSETSSRSTKLIWAGLKYMATASAALLSKNLFTSPVATVKDFLGEMHMVLECHNGEYFCVRLWQILDMIFSLPLLEHRTEIYDSEATPFMQLGAHCYSIHNLACQPPSFWSLVVWFLSDTGAFCDEVLRFFVIVSMPSVLHHDINQGKGSVSSASS
jgi:FAD dependent oxidoreductase